ncbi:lincosamide and streptogramin A transport system ATP-binding/permease protein [Pilibacter termitis]|uniref:Lincosamide and streptogramin A transport system ATP-binding/permease protein n=1 Tax=Pilibacter termitis TaxID=263852 RepID=A0A1T4N4T8_9ENTE|nr:ABC-F type ribosomal protection protein [Pilibacter termitis]SJZ73878.1 lincosamide and streptogramin A transport system ATP-binding/permease protein [Pilibacter termitis]
MSKIELKNMSFSYGGEREVFQKVDLTLESDWKLGLIGRNGRGKTTLLRLLTGELCCSGEIIHQMNVVYFPEKIENQNELTLFALQEIREFEQWKLERELHLLNVDLDVLYSPFSTLSGGEKTKVLLALLFLDEQNFPLIDEPTNHLDMKSREIIASYLKNKRQGFIVASHDREFVDKIVNHVLTIEKTQLMLYKGNFSTYEEQKKRRDETEMAQNGQLKKEIVRLKKTTREKKEWSLNKEGEKRGAADKGFIGARAARLMKKSKNLERRMEKEIEQKQCLLKEIEETRELKMNFTPSHHKSIFTVENLTLSFSEKKLFLPISFELKKGEVLAIQGMNGIGKTSLIHALLGNFQGEMTGEIHAVQNMKISYVHQEHEGNKGTLSEFAKKKKIDYEYFLNNLRKLGMEMEVFSQKIENMSLGQRKKVELAKSLTEQAELYVWDEPLNYLDVFNHVQIENVIKNFKPTMIVIEHDKRFIENVAEKVVKLERKKLSEQANKILLS